MISPGLAFFIQLIVKNAVNHALLQAGAHFFSRPFLHGFVFIDCRVPSLSAALASFVRGSRPCGCMLSLQVALRYRNAGLVKSAAPEAIQDFGNFGVMV